MSLLTQIAWLLALVWLCGAALTLFALLRQTFLRPADAARLKIEGAPFVSVLLPARDEERRILSECVRSVLAQDYPRFEVVVVDDRSTDATLQILHALARDDDRLRVVEGRELPDGWLGKPYALRQALDVARGEWVLTTDADMIFRPSALRAAVGYALARGCDALSLVPHFETGSFWERVFIPSWLWGMLVLYPQDLLNRRRTRTGIGFGAFFLIRRTALERAGGFEAVRDDVIEDVRLAENVRRAGVYLRFEYAPDLVSTRMYTNLPELWESSSKNLFGALKYSVPHVAGYLVWTLAVGVFPLVLLAVSAAAVSVGGEAWRPLLLPSLLACAMQAAAFGAACARFRVPAYYALTAPLGFALMCAVMLHSALAVVTGRGVSWKGRKIYESGGLRPPRARKQYRER